MRSENKDQPVVHDIHGKIIELWIKLINFERATTATADFKKISDPKKREEFTQSSKPLTPEEMYERRAGFCHGIAMMGLQAALLGEQDLKSFNDRVMRIANINHDDFIRNAALIKNKVIAKVRKAKETSSTVQLTPEEEMYYDTLAFFNSAELYHRPKRHIQIFQKDEKDEARVDHRNYVEVSQIVSPARKTDNVMAEGLAKIQSSYAEFQPQSLLDYLEIIDKAAKAQQLKTNFGIVLTSLKHTITLNYNAVTKKWIMIDANQLPIIEEPLSLELTTKLMKGFTPNNCLSMAVVCPQQQKENVSALFSRLETDLKKFQGFGEQLKNFDRSNKPKIDLQGMYQFAVSNGDLIAINKLYKYYDKEIEELKDRDVISGRYDKVLELAIDNSQLELIAALYTQAPEKFVDRLQYSISNRDSALHQKIISILPIELFEKLTNSDTHYVGWMRIVARSGDENAIRQFADFKKDNKEGSFFVLLDEAVRVTIPADAKTVPADVKSTAATVLSTIQKMISVYKASISKAGITSQEFDACLRDFFDGNKNTKLKELGLVEAVYQLILKHHISDINLFLWVQIRESLKPGGQHLLPLLLKHNKEAVLAYKDKNDATSALMKVVAANREDLVTALIEQKADVLVSRPQRGNEPNTALGFAVRQKNSKIIKMLLARYPNSITLTEKNKWQDVKEVIQFAFKEKDSEILDLLFSKIPPQEIEKLLNDKVIVAELGNKDKHFFGWLLEKRLQILAEAKDTPKANETFKAVIQMLIEAAEKGQKIGSQLKLLMNTYKAKDTLYNEKSFNEMLQSYVFSALENHQTKFLQALFKVSKESVNQPNSEGILPLEFLASRGDDKLFEMLLSVEGVNVSAKRNASLERALEQQNATITKMILKQFPHQRLVKFVGTLNTPREQNVADSTLMDNWFRKGNYEFLTVILNARLLAMAEDDDIVQLQTVDALNPPARLSEDFIVKASLDYQQMLAKAINLVAKEEAHSQIVSLLIYHYGNHLSEKAAYDVLHTTLISFINQFDNNSDLSEGQRIVLDQLLINIARLQEKGLSARPEAIHPNLQATSTLNDYAAKENTNVFICDELQRLNLIDQAIKTNPIALAREFLARQDEAVPLEILAPRFGLNVDLAAEIKKPAQQNLSQPVPQNLSRAAQQTPSRAVQQTPSQPIPQNLSRAAQQTPSQPVPQNLTQRAASTLTDASFARSNGLFSQRPLPMRDTLNPAPDPLNTVKDGKALASSRVVDSKKLPPLGGKLPSLTTGQQAPAQPTKTGKKIP